MPIQTAADSISNSAGSPYGFKNRIINGAMVIDQRNAGASVTGNDGIFAVDRFRTEVTQSSKLTMQQNAGSVTPPPGFQKYIGFTSSSSYSITSTDRFAWAQWIEGYSVADLDLGTSTAKTFTLSFWARSSLTGTFGGTCIGYDQSGTFRSYTWSYTITQANTWEYKTITIPGDTTSFPYGKTNNYGLFVSFSLGMGSTFTTTPNVWTAGLYYAPTTHTSLVATNGATLYITGLQLEVGSQATAFDYRPYSTELALCQRYFQKSFNQSLAVGTTGSLSGAINLITYVTSSTYATIPVQLTPQMRATPTVTWYSYVTGATGKLVVSGTDYNVDAQTGYYSDSRIYFGWESNATGNRQILGHYTASAEL